MRLSITVRCVFEKESVRERESGRERQRVREKVDSEGFTWACACLLETVTNYWCYERGKNVLQMINENICSCDSVDD